LRNTVVSKRYANSLIELAQEFEKLDHLFADMIALQEITECVPHFIKALSDERIPINKRVAAAENICKDLNLWNYTRNAFLLLLKKRRISLLPQIAQEVFSIIRFRKKMAVAHIQAANKFVAEEVKEDVEKILTRLLGLSVQSETEIDPGLLGGFVLKIGDISFDSSIKGKLTRMKEEFFSESKGY
jgi:F-type H+-transporting ATPase subunit delta